MKIKWKEWELQQVMNSRKDMKLLGLAAISGTNLGKKQDMSSLSVYEVLIISSV